MILKTSVRATVNPDYLHGQCTKAEHAVAIQAERDCRPYVPSATGRLRSSGRVSGNVITWDTPYARLQYFGKVYVDPVRKIAGFPTPDGWRSFRGTKKIRSERNFHHVTGGPQWFKQAKDLKIGDWLRLAQGVIVRG